MLVDFFIVGTQKAGTSALDRHLRMFPAVQMASVKEIHFFDDEDVDWSRPDYARLHRSFDWDDPRHVIRGEATPIYAYWPNALVRLHHYNPAARLIMALRHPAFRAYSHWRMETKRGADQLPFSDAIREPGRRRVAAAPNGAHRVFSYVERGFVASQIETALGLFSRERLLFLRTDALWNDPCGTLDRVADFLQVPARLDFETHYVVPLLSWDPTAMAPEDRRYLDELYADDIRRSARFSGLDLSDWIDPAYEEPMRPE